MKLEFLNDDGDAVATVESTPRSGIVCEGDQGSQAAAIIDSLRPALKSKLGRQPNAEELIEALQASEHANRFRARE